ncbi:7-deoxyloganetic acid glucosyltransferase [Forsythia ovata]|uniref:7-deoxyloganetic acid glucosyltransferase n=1 Tax=Forsythia ovata TaxID=205694 RepID=A0ABD1WGI6_9LAMI
MSSQEASLPPHVLIFPLPVQGHVNSMLMLAELLCVSGLDITFMVSDFSHNRLLKHTTVASRFERYAGFSFQSISDGLPDDHPRAGKQASPFPAVLVCLPNSSQSSAHLSLPNSSRPVRSRISSKGRSFSSRPRFRSPLAGHNHSARREGKSP